LGAPSARVAQACSKGCDNPDLAPLEAQRFSGAANWTILGTELGSINDAHLPSASKYNAFEGAYVLAVNGMGIGEPEGYVDVTESGLRTGVQEVDGLEVVAHYHFSADLPIARIMYVLHNPTSQSISVTAAVSSDLHSGDNTTIEATSDGDLRLERKDKWMVTWDQGELNTELHRRHPVIAFSRYGSGTGRGVAAPQPVFAPGPGTGAPLASASDRYVEVFPLKVKAGRTSRILLFAALSEDVETAKSHGATFESIEALAEAGLLEGLADSDLAEIVNY